MISVDHNKCRKYNADYDIEMIDNAECHAGAVMHAGKGEKEEKQAKQVFLKSCMCKHLRYLR